MWSLCTILVALVTIVVSAVAPPADTFDVSTCTYMSPATGTSFDLSALTLPEADSYSIRDPYSDNKNTTFFFNVCGATRKPDTALCTGDIAAAYRLDVTPTCISMGYIKGTKMALVDTSQPSVGIDITYAASKQRCPGTNSTASFSLRLLCGPAASAGVDRVDILRDCGYRATLTHPRACPRECPVSDRGVCSGNGLCRLDTDAAHSRCFCNNGFFGPACTSSVDPDSGSGSCTGTCAALAVVLIFLLVALAGAGVLLWRLRKMSHMPVVFQSGFTDPQVYSAAYEQGRVLGGARMLTARGGSSGGVRSDD